MKKRALVLSGGGNRGAYEVGVLKYLICEKGLRYDTIIGVSVGALNSLFLSQYDIENQDTAVVELEKIWNEIEQKHVFKPWENSYLKTFLYSLLGYKSSFLDSEPLRELIKINKKNNGTNVHLLVGVTDLNTGKFHVFDGKEKNIDDYVLASSSIPVIFPPVVVNGATYVDGGIRSNTPLYSILEKDEYSCVDVIMLVPKEEEYNIKTTKEPKTIYGILYKTIEILGHKILHSDINVINTYHFIEELEDSSFGKRTKVNVYAPKTNMLGVNNFFTVLNFNKEKIQYYIKSGYDDAKTQYKI